MQYVIASEWKSFLLFYVPVTLHGILSDKYYIHALLLVKSLRILLADSITKEDLKKAHNMLKKFCELMEKYYGKHKLTRRCAHVQSGLQYSHCVSLSVSHSVNYLCFKLTH